MDRMRTNLIMHFHCAVCGAQLNIKHPKNEVVESKPSSLIEQIPKEPTGAACYYTPKIQIEPCRKCFEPVLRFKKVTSEISDVLNGK